MNEVFIYSTVLAAAIIAYGLGMGWSDATISSVIKPETQPKTAVFAGGCFWCTETDFQKIPGVLDVIPGYTGGSLANPTYHQVCSGGTGHVEAVQVVYDPARVGYRELLDFFWHHMDPTDAGGQFVDRGSQYGSAIFYADEEQRCDAEASKAALEASGQFNRPIVTRILPQGPFYPAEEYHQNFSVKNPDRYHNYRRLSGRDTVLSDLWKTDKLARYLAAEKKKSNNEAPQSGNGDSAEARALERYSIPDDSTLRSRLTPLQYHVVRQNGTEPAFDNEYWNNHEQGIYVDIVSGEPLFSSADKFDSGTGWPSFTRPLVPENIVEKTDRSFFMTRTEIRSKHADSHLGHVFSDGPKPTGLRYCMNSAALRFVPRADLEKEGYGRFLGLFE